MKLPDMYWMAGFIGVEIDGVARSALSSPELVRYLKEALDAPLRDFADTHRSVHVGKPFGVRHAPALATHANATMRMTRGDPLTDRETLQTAVLAVDDNGTRALFVNSIYTTRLEGMSEAESAPYLDQLYRHWMPPDFACRHRWRPGDFVIWNNRTALHYATNDYDGYRRLLYRTTLADNLPC